MGNPRAQHNLRTRHRTCHELFQTLSRGTRTCAKAEGQSPKTVKETVACIRRFSQFLGGDPTLGDIGADELLNREILLH
jgi:hypothetical protein